MLTEQHRSDYERAAAALERHLSIVAMPETEGDIACRAFLSAWRSRADWPSDNECDDQAARLLRECIEKGEVLK